jgi:hypothetical protein
MKTITLDYDYTLNGAVRWPNDVAHEANEELRKLLADGVAGAESEADDGVQASAQAAEQGA